MSVEMLTRSRELLADLLAAIAEEAGRQDALWGWPLPESFHEADGVLRLKAFDLETQCRRSLDEVPSWAAILGEEFAEAARERDPEKRVEELVQVAAVALSWAAAICEQLLSRPFETQGLRKEIREALGAHPMSEPCVVCGKSVETCELGECGQAGHEDGVEVSPQGWVCSVECWEIATAEGGAP